MRNSWPTYLKTATGEDFTIEAGTEGKNPHYPGFGDEKNDIPEPIS